MASLVASYDVKNTLHLPMAQYSISQTQASGLRVGIDNPVASGVRLGHYNHWMVIRGVDEGGNLYTVWGSFILHRIPEFCGGALLHGVYILANLVPSSLSSNWPHLNTMNSIRSRQDAMYSRYPNDAKGPNPDIWKTSALLEDIEDGTCPFPSINELLGQEHVPASVAYKYMLNMMGESMMITMRMNRQRVLFAADREGGMLGDTLMALRSRLASNGGMLITLATSVNNPWDTLLNQHSAGSPTYLYEYSAKVSKSAPLVNWNSGSPCRRYGIQIANVESIGRHSLTEQQRESETRVKRILKDLTAIPRESDTPNMLYKLMLHAPLYMPPGMLASPPTF